MHIRAPGNRQHIRVLGLLNFVMRKDISNVSVDPAAGYERVHAPRFAVLFFVVGQQYNAAWRWERRVMLEVLQKRLRLRGVGVNEEICKVLFRHEKKRLVDVLRVVDRSMFAELLHHSSGLPRIKIKNCIPHCAPPLKKRNEYSYLMKANLSTGRLDGFVLVKPVCYTEVVLLTIRYMIIIMSDSL